MKPCLLHSHLPVPSPAQSTVCTGDEEAVRKEKFQTNTALKSEGLRGRVDANSEFVPHAPLSRCSVIAVGGGGVIVVVVFMLFFYIF